MATKPDKMQQDLFSRLVETFPDEDDLIPILGRFTGEKVTTIARAQLLSRDDLVAMGLPRGLAVQVQHLFASSPAQAAEEPKGLDRLASSLDRMFAAKLEDLPLPDLLDRLLKENGSNPSLVSFADQRHPDLSTRGLVLAPGADKVIDKKATLDYLAQPRSYLGQRWASQRVVRVSEAFGVKEEFNPFVLTRALQNGIDPETDVDFSPFDPMERNFLAWVGEKKPQLVRDDGHGLVEVMNSGGLMGSIKTKPRFAKAVTEYEEACADNPSLATAYLTRLYRAPGSRREDGHGGPFARSPSVATTIDRSRFREAILSAFNLSSLNHALLFQMDTRLEVITSLNQGFGAVVDDVLRWAESEDKVTALYKALREQNPTNTVLAALVPGPKPWDRDRLRSFRVVLSQNYTVAEQIRAFASDVGLPLSRIGFDGSAENVWFRVLEEAQRHGLLDECLKRAKDDYPAAFGFAGF